MAQGIGVIIEVILYLRLYYNLRSKLKKEAVASYFMRHAVVVWRGRKRWGLL